MRLAWGGWELSQIKNKTKIKKTLISQAKTICQLHLIGCYTFRRVCSVFLLLSLLKRFPLI